MTLNKEELFVQEEEKTTGKNIQPISPKSVSTGIMQPAIGTEAIRGEDTTFPRFRLLQSTSLEVETGESKPGIIKHSLTENVYDKIEIIPLTLILSRVMFNPDDRKGAPVCRSVDLIHGSTYGPCEQCEYKDWIDSKTPQCGLVYNYPVLTPEQIGNTALPTLISFMKSSTQVALKINTLIKYSMPPIPFWNHVWELSVTLKKFKKGNAYTYNIKQLRETNEKEREWCLNVYENCIKGRKVELTEEEVTE